jgi:hypothetical protein
MEEKASGKEVGLSDLPSISMHPDPWHFPPVVIVPSPSLSSSLAFGNYPDVLITSESNLSSF